VHLRSKSGRIGLIVRVGGSTPSACIFPRLPDIRTVDYDPFTKSQLASRNWLLGVMWCTSGHVTPRNPAPARPSYSAVWIPRVVWVGGRLRESIDQMLLVKQKLSHRFSTITSPIVW